MLLLKRVYKKMAAKYDKTISTQEYDSQRELDLAEWEEQLKMPQYTQKSSAFPFWNLIT